MRATTSPRVLAVACVLPAPCRLGTGRRPYGSSGGRFARRMNRSSLKRYILAWGCAWVLPLSIGAATEGAVFEVTSGLTSYQVLQRNASDRADVELAGKVTAEGADAIEARVLRRRLVVEGFDWTQVGSAGGERWTANIKALPVGGPYQVELRALNKAGDTLSSTAVQSILVGDLWMLTGQSNMVGNGRLENLETTHELVHNFNVRDEWQVAEEPLHSLAESIDEAHWAHATHLLSLWGVGA